MPTDEQIRLYHDQGFFVADDAVDPSTLPALTAAARRAKHKVRAGEVDVFTHWATKEDTEPWAIRGLLAPQFDEPAFGEYLMSEPPMAYVRRFLGPV